MKVVGSERMNFFMIFLRRILGVCRRFFFMGGIKVFLIFFSVEKFVKKFVRLLVMCFGIVVFDLMIFWV